DERLIEQDLAERARVVGDAQAGEHRVELRRPVEDVRSEAAQRAIVQLEDGAVPQNAFDAVAAQHEPGAADTALAARAQRPPAGHAQMRAHDDAAREPEAQVLADRLDGLEGATVDRLGGPRRAAAWVGRLGGDALTDERLQPTRRTVQRVA